MTSPLGTWSNAPLAYVLAEVRTELISNIKDYQPKIGGRFREEYPVQRTLHAAKLIATESQLVVEPGNDSATAWEFATPDNRIAVILRSNGVVLHATAYIDSKDFMSRLQRVISLVAKEVPSLYVNRLGLRYIDFILPKNNEVPEDYVDRRLNPDLGLSSKLGGSVAATSLAIYPVEGGSLTFRYIRGSGKPELPPDLKNINLNPSGLMESQPIPESMITAILDTDCIYTCSPVKLEAKRVLEQFVLMHKDVSRAFQTAITDHARKVWEAK